MIFPSLPQSSPVFPSKSPVRNPLTSPHPTPVSYGVWGWGGEAINRGRIPRFPTPVFPQSGDDEMKVLRLPVITSCGEVENATIRYDHVSAIVRNEIHLAGGQTLRVVSWPPCSDAADQREKWEAWAEWAQ